MSLPVRVTYKNKKNSSGWIHGGEIVLAISSRLSPLERERHVAELTRRLQATAIRQARRQPLALAVSSITTDLQLAQLVNRLNREHYGFPLKRSRFWQQRSRWGSCMVQKQEIHISHRLQGAPLLLLEYVVIHELCHLKEPNHGPRFWRLVMKACPDYKERRRMLATYGEVGLQPQPVAAAD